MRLLIVGTSGSGKSTLAGRLSARLAIPHVELDAINWQADWQDLNSRDRNLFRGRVAQAAGEATWIADGNYRSVQDILLARATDVVWLDYPWGLVMRRVIWRSLVRSLSGAEIWAGTGNREGFDRWLSRDHPIRWAWSTHHARRRRYQTQFIDDPPKGATIHRIRTLKELKALETRLESGGLSSPAANSR